MTRLVSISRGATTLIDDEDFERVKPFKWTLDLNGYVSRMASYYVDGVRRRRKVLLHRFLIDAPDGMDVDHQNHIRTDNRKKNLRLASRSQNNANSAPRPGCTSNYKGVSAASKTDGWVARICINGSQKRLGTFKDQVSAARAYDEAAKEAWGDFAHLNFPNP